MLFRTSGYGITDKYTYNDDIKLRLVETEGKYYDIQERGRREFKKGLDLIINGKRINGSKKYDDTTYYTADA